MGCGCKKSINTSRRVSSKPQVVKKPKTIVIRKK